jgi:hypothetical protein
MDKFYEGNKDDLFKSVGLFNPLKRKCNVIDDQSKCCDICFEDEVDQGVISLKCGHNFCGLCMSRYLIAELENVGKSAMTCAGYKCNWIIEDDVVMKFLRNKKIETDMKP